MQRTVCVTQLQPNRGLLKNINFKNTNKLLKWEKKKVHLLETILGRSLLQILSSGEQSGQQDKVSKIN